MPINHTGEIMKMTSILKPLAAGVLAFTASFALAADAAPNDAQIAGIVVAANTVDINAGKQAESKTHNSEVKAFAKQMVTDHSAVNQQASDLVKKLNVTPEESATSKSLQEGGEATRAKLSKLKGKAFDKAYVDNEVAYHEAVLDAMDKTLIPNAKNEELKNTLIKVRPAFVAHLEHAKHIQASLK
jgi:putative membrane protein